MERNSRLPLGLAFFLILVIVISACAPPAPSGDDPVSRRASPTPGEASAPTVGSSLQPAPVPSSLQARLSVLRLSAKVITREGIETEVQRAQSADLHVDDAVEVIQPAGQNEQSYSILHVPDVLNVELLGDTKVFLADVRQGGDGSAEITLDIDRGHMLVHLNQEQPGRVTIQTPYATIRSLTSGAEFDVCRDESLTCVGVKYGIVEILAGEKREIVKAGEAGVVLKNTTPSAAICAPDPFFLGWEERFRNAVDAASLREAITGLPQKACPVTADGLPLNARILYRDEFSAASSGWYQGGVDSFLARYIRSEGPRYYQVQAQGPGDPYLAFVPDGRVYEDVNIDVRALIESAGSGDFRYGILFRRTGNQFYAFAISPGTDTWYFLKNSANGLDVLKDGIDRRMRGLEGQDTLRVESYGPIFLLYINGRFIDWVSDAEYTRGEGGLFVESLDASGVTIGFNSITLWDIPAPALDSQGEKCFNVIDDDGDGQVDQADPSCQRPDVVVTAPPTAQPRPSSTPILGNTPSAPSATNPPSIPTLPPLPTLPVPTLPVPTVVIPPLPTLLPLPLPLPTIDLPLP
jgi:hypothetical protein